MLDGKTRRELNTKNGDEEKNVFLKDHLAGVRRKDGCPGSDKVRDKQRSFTNQRHMRMAGGGSIVS
jgi:hypothetical protein